MAISFITAKCQRKCSVKDSQFRKEGEKMRKVEPFSEYSLWCMIISFPYFLKDVFRFGKWLTKWLVTYIAMLIIVFGMFALILSIPTPEKEAYEKAKVAEWHRQATQQEYRADAPLAEQGGWIHGNKKK